MTTTINSFPNVTGQMPFANPAVPGIGGTNGAPFAPAFLTHEQQQINALKETVSRLEARLAAKDSAASGDMEKRLAETDEGCKFLRAKHDGITQILTEWALTNPLIAPKVQAFLDGWKKDAQAFLEGQG